MKGAVNVDYKTYSNGERTIQATPVIFEMLYKSQGFRPFTSKAGGNNDKGRSNRHNKPENPVISPTETTDEQPVADVD